MKYCFLLLLLSIYSSHTTAQKTEDELQRALDAQHPSGNIPAEIHSAAREDRQNFVQEWENRLRSKDLEVSRNLRKLESEKKLVPTEPGFISLDTSKLSITPITKSVLRSERSFTKKYPWVYKQIKAKRILVSYGRSKPKEKDPSGAEILPFDPPEHGTRGTTQQNKKKIADDYLAYIRSKCQPLRCYDKKIFPLYYKLEAQMVPDKNPDKLIAMRQKFIAHLKTLKCQ